MRMQFDLFTESHQSSSFTRTSPDFSPTKPEPTDVFLRRLPAKLSRWNHQGADGQTLVVCLVPKEQSLGASSMPNISPWPNDAAVCSLSQVLETGSIPPRYFLSGTACAGILRRAEKRGKSLPPSLAEALAAVASAQTSTATVDPIARCDTAGEAKRQDWETCNFVAHTLKAEGFDASKDGTGRGTPLVPVAFPANLSGTQCASTEDLSPAMGAKNPTAVAFAIQAGALRTNPASGPDGVGVQSDHAYTLEARAEVQAVAFAENSSAEVRLEGGDGSRCGAISTGGGKPGQGVPMAVAAMQVRRLTPKECARLQGFPDDYLDIMYRNKPAADGPKYKALGNSWAVPAVQWIGQRIQEAV